LKNFGLRVLIAIFGIPLILGTIYFGGTAFLILVLIINVVSQFEFYKLSQKKGAAPLTIIGIIMGVIITLLFYFQGLANFGLWFIGGVVLILLIELFRNKPNATLNLATTIMGIIYPTTLFSFLILIREYPHAINQPYHAGGLWLWVIVITIWICDTAAYFVGKGMGKHTLYYRVSPHKTVEGAIAGFIFSFITVYVFYIIRPDLFTLTQYFIIAALVGVFSQIGDLVESIIKRDVGVKDSSAILPGHGGFMDRFDAPTFMAPVMYMFLVCAKGLNLF